MQEPPSTRFQEPAESDPPAALAEELSRLWRQGQQPGVAAFLAQAGALRPDQLAAVLLVDQRQRWQRGERLGVEIYLQAYPTLGAEPEAVLDLIYGEYLLRREQEEVPTLSEFARRFPEYAQPLRLQVELRQALDASSGLLADPYATREGDGGAMTTAEPYATRAEGGAGTAGPAAPPSAWPRLPGYEILGPLGWGGMGVVYKARQLGLARYVAVKMIRADAGADPELLARFRTEAEAVARLQHPHIVQIHEVGEWQGLPYCVLEYVDGGSLAERWSGQPQVPSQVAELVAILARAMEAAHQAGIVHRDLKPGNILLRRTDGKAPVAEGGPAPANRRAEHPLIPKITDFGLAKRLDVALGETQTGTRLGTPSYMAPEQARGQNKQVGPASDVYALGAILYTGLTGRPPFLGADPLDTLRQVVDHEPVPPRQLQPKVPRDLETICLKCLRKEAGKRYSSALALAEDLERFLAGKPIQARRVPLWEQGVKWAKRRPALASLLASCAAAFVGLVVATILLTRAYQRERDAKNEATQQKIQAEKNFALARKAVDETTTKVAENPRLKEADFHALRKELLASAVPFYEEFVQQPGADAALEAERGRAYGRLGYVLEEMGEKEKAMQQFERRREVFAQLATMAPEEADYRCDLAGSHNCLGVMLAHLGRREEAESAFRSALAVQEQLAKDFPAVPKYRKELATSHNNLGLLLTTVGKREEAAIAFRAALNLQEPLAKEFPAEAGYRQVLARSYSNQGNLLIALGKAQEAETVYRAALAIWEQLAADFPTVPDYRQGTAFTHNSLSALLAGLGKQAEAEKGFRAAIAIQGRIVADFPAVPEYRQELAQSHNNLAIVLAGQGKRDDADTAYHAALAIQERLVKDFPAMPDYAVELAGSYGNLGNLVRNGGQPQASLDWYERALSTLAPVLQAEPRLVSARQCLRSVLVRRALALISLQRNADALRDWDQLLESDEGPPGRDAIRLQRALTLVHLGDHVRATAEAQELAQAKAMASTTLYDLACVYALASVFAHRDATLALAEQERLASDYASRSVGLLAKAQAAGFFKEQAEFEHLKKDPDLDPLRSRPDFQQLLHELEGKAGTQVP